MRGFLIRLRLFLKLWCTFIYSLLTIVLIPIIGIIIYNSGTYTIDDLSSLIYENIATIWFVFIIQWCFSVDLDSKFYNQLITYPVSRWRFLLERTLFSIIIFVVLVVIITLPLGFILGNFVWKGFVFSIPVYLAIGGIVILGTMIGNHSLGGLIAGILFWMTILFGGALLRELNAILLKYGSVERVVSGESGLFLAENRWILFNRLFYIGLGVICTIGAILKNNRKSA
ncbi:hypothetical protein ACFFF5_11620 [Lederbergia wuyishanensis]|uniref:ABC-type transport system involved in multi-copper enzyme maturation permease subunit n=1 Tax=Lederbergia wuyishanensis TaxID=1347903 RepID=A0ABU0D3Z9_9BACI|nr:hypothetical protein [Lederbergia wuyishanensis]MCJ8008278.1 hypothetical protein [Lederbergia wuyishanensis]MDQ0343131.1 ABC-type transport system involved in multi-copper enzyme maturation permease subunit [Lederbergia wuyishanensis]